MRLVSLLMLACVTGWAGSGGQKLTLRQGYPFVDVSINGQGPFRMLVDTGADASLLTPQAARKASLKLDHRVLLTTLTGEKIVSGASGNVIQVGEVEESGLKILVVELPSGESVTAEADGVLGQSFLSRRPYLLDYQQKRLWFGEEATALSANLPHQIAATHTLGRTVLQVALDNGGATWQLTLDSGSTSLVVDCSERCPRAWGVQRDSRLLTHAGERSVLRGTLRQVRLGDLPMATTEAVLLDAATERAGDDGVLPTRLFSAFYVNGAVVRFAAAR